MRASFLGRPRGRTTPRVAALDTRAGENRPVADRLIAVPLPEPALSADDLRLRAWRDDDAQVVLAAGRDELISRYRYSLPRTAADAKRWIAKTHTDRLAGERLELAIVEQGALVGSVALADIRHGNAMIRYWLLPQGRGHGLATRSVGLLIEWAFATLGIGRVAAFIELENAASRAVLDRCGFVRERRLRQHFTDHDGNRVDTLLYGLLPEDIGSSG